MPIEVGDLKKQTFKEIWNNSSVLKELGSSEDLKEHCGICVYRSACGGCRARAYAYFGDLKAPDPGCINNHKAFLQLEKKGMSAIKTPLSQVPTRRLPWDSLPKTVPESIAEAARKKGSRA